MKNCIVIRNDDHLIIQEAIYIEHGNYIKVTNSLIEVWEIPYGGGYEYLVRTCSTLQEAFELIDTLT